MENQNSNESQNNTQDGMPTFTEEQLNRLKSADKIMRGISWIKSIALFSVINTVIFSFGTGVSFIIGFGITQLATAVIMFYIPDTQGMIISFVFSLLVSGLFFLLWFFAQKMHTWALIAALILYALDSIVFLLVADYLSFGFHLYAGYFMFEATRELIKQNTDR